MVMGERPINLQDFRSGRYGTASITIFAWSRSSKQKVQSSKAGHLKGWRGNEGCATQTLYLILCEADVNPFGREAQLAATERRYKRT